MISIKYTATLLGCLLIGSSCDAVRKEKKASAQAVDTQIDTIRPQQESAEDSVRLRTSPMSLYMDSLGLLNIAALDSTISVSLMYTKADNFTGEILYDDLSEAYLHPDAAVALLNAQRLLKEQNPSYSLLVYDAARPMSVQKKMWKVVRGTSKSKYVSNPANGGGLHNYGLAVDISIQDSLGCPLPMGTKVDHLGIEAHITNETDLVLKGKISESERQNRLLLRKVMKGAGFRALPSEWWHFNYCSRDSAKKKYKIIP